MATIENVVIIGGGVAGLSAALYNARAGLNPLIIAGSPPGGQLSLTSEVENFPSQESIMGAELVQKIRAQAEKFKARIIDENVIKVDFSKRPFRIYLQRHTQTTDSITAKTVIVATGAKAVWLGLESEKRLIGHGVSACATCDAFFFRGKTVAIVGGGDAALEEADFLTRFAQKVYIIHRRNEFRASKAMQDKIFNNKKIEIIWETVIEEVLGEKKVEGVRLKLVGIGQSWSGVSTKKTSSISKPIQQVQPTSTNSTLKLDGLFVAIGRRPETEIFQGQLEMDEKGYIITVERAALELLKILSTKHETRNNNQNTNTQNSFGNLDLGHFDLFRISNFGFQNSQKEYKNMTSVSGIFAAGDCADNLYRQASVAAGSGVVASLEVGRWLEDNSGKI